MLLVSDWSLPPTSLYLKKEEVHIWRASLKCTPEWHLRLRETLSEDELSRASRFVFPRDQDRFVAGRGILRSILGRYLQRPAGSIRFVYGLQGKPNLLLDHSDPPIRFNVSHSQGLAVFAFSYDREIGVDIETSRTGLEIEDIAGRYFSSSELAEFRALPPEKRPEGFLTCWTRKEAYLKAIGSGLSVSLDTFDVSLTPGKPARLVSGDNPRWTLFSFQPENGYAGAVVADGNDWTVRSWDFNDAVNVSPL